jgi:DNA primase
VTATTGSEPQDPRDSCECKLPESCIRCNWPQLSNNVLLIAAQRPDATAVAGFGAWKALGRQVNKGSTAIAILAPLTHRTTPAAGPGPTADRPPDQDTTPQAGPVEGEQQPGASNSRGGRVGGFKVVHVFDVSDTTGQPLATRPVPVMLAGQAPEGLWDAVATQVKALGFTLRRGDCGGPNGITDFRHRTVTVRADVDDAQASKTLLHELGHALMHDPTGLTTGTPAGTTGPARDPVAAPARTSTELCRGRLEVEAESVAFLVASTHSLDTGAYTFPYVAGWASEVTGTPLEQVVQSTAARVIAAAKTVLAGTEHLLATTTPGQTLEQNVHQDLHRHDQDLTLPADADRGAALLSTAQDIAQHVHHTTAATTTAPTKTKTKTTVTPKASRIPSSAAGLTDRLTYPPAALPAGQAPDRLIQVHALAVGFYTGRLHADGPDARRAIALLTDRGVDQDSAVAAQLGYAPRAWTTLVDHLRDVGINDVELRASGLVLESSRGTLLDRFRDRVIFPLNTLGGQTVALLGRAVDPTATDRDGTRVPKYLNSPDTAIYRKSEHLYGLSAATAEAIRGGAQPVIVEGPLDVLAVNRAARSSVGAGHRHFAVAPCGTALTRAQVQLLDTATGGLTDRGIMTAFDGDDPGRQASLRAYDLLREIQAWPTTLDLPAGHDPDSFAAEHGAAALQVALQGATAKPLADLVVDERIARHHLRWPEGQISACRAASAVVAAMPPEHATRQIIRIIAHTGLDPQTVTDLILDAITNPTRTPGAPLAASPDRTRVTANCTAAQRARAGFPVALKASLSPQHHASPTSSLPVDPKSDQQHHSRTA